MSGGGTEVVQKLFEQPTRYYLEINRKTANALGVKIPQELLMRTDRVIE